MTTRKAVAGDGPALQLIDHQTWSPQVTPAPVFSAAGDFFAHNALDDVIVAVAITSTATTAEQAEATTIAREVAIAGYVKVTRPTELAAHAHVQKINGLAVTGAWQGQGVGRLLVQAALAEAARRGARRLTLRVLGGNLVAQRLYASCGFVVEGREVEEFLLEGRYVDDILMAATLPQEGGTR